MRTAGRRTSSGVVTVSQARWDANPFEDGSAAVALRGLPAFDEALARLLHTAEHGRPFGIVRGPTGTGKSQLLVCVAREAHGCVQIDLRRSSATEFVDQLCDELGVAPTAKPHSWKHVEDALLGRAHAARPTLLLLDHLDAAEAELLRQVERLLAVAETSAGWCTVLAAGRVPSDQVEAIARAHGELRIELGPFEAAETAQYLQQVVMQSDCLPFSDQAAAAVHDATGGLLRDILRLGRLALFAAATEEADEVTAETVWMVTGELSSPRSAALPHRTPPAIAPATIDALTADF
jgi:general secretion pathway protein A